MIVRTFTSTWNLRTKIYAFDDVKLPIKGGVTVPQFIAGLVTAVIWIPLCLILQMPNWMPSGFAFAIMAGVPIVVLIKADTPIAHEKTTEEWLNSWVSRRTEPNALAALAPLPERRQVVLTATRWVPKHPEDYYSRGPGGV